MAADIRGCPFPTFTSAPQPIRGRARLPAVPVYLVAILNEIGRCNRAPIDGSNSLETIYEEHALPNHHSPKITAQDETILWDPDKFTISGVLEYASNKEDEQPNRLAFTSQLETTCSSIGQGLAVSGVDVRPISSEDFSHTQSKIELLAEAIVHEWLNSPADPQSGFLVKEELRELR